MKGEQSVTAIITARGGSKGLPKKNIQLLNGKPLIAYTIEAALQCYLVDGCYVTTDDSEIRDISLQNGAEVITRPPELAGDTSLSKDAVKHALQHIAAESTLPEYFTLLQPTSPLRTSVHLNECLSTWIASDFLCAISVVEAEHHPWKMVLENDGKMVPLYDVNALERPRQKLPKAYRVNGAIYAMKSKLFLECETFYVEPVMYYIMGREESVDIDNLADLSICERILKK